MLYIWAHLENVSMNEFYLCVFLNIHHPLFRGRANKLPSRSHISQILYRTQNFPPTDCLILKSTFEELYNWIYSFRTIFQISIARQIRPVCILQTCTFRLSFLKHISAMKLPVPSKRNEIFYVSSIADDIL